jgi:UDP-N-acetylglucosamine 4,6-dehydratase
MNKHILITGGAGYFGQAMVRRLLQQGGLTPARICIYSRSEAAQARMRAALGDPANCRWFIGDVRDRRRLTRAMEGVDQVVHAAALKRVEVGEYNPSEMVQTNIGGAQNVIDAAIDAGVSKVVALSSDKACEPLNCYGATKLVAEKLFLAANQIRTGPANTRYPQPVHFSVVRYGNVAGSTGSVIPTWRQALAQGVALQVRNVDSTRFWMTVEAATEMVLWSLTRPTGGELIAPDLPAYRLGDLLVAMAGQGRAQAMYGAARARGEKLHETMISVEESRGFKLAGKYWVHGQETDASQFEAAKMRLSSATAVRMSIPELREALERIPE